MIETGKRVRVEDPTDEYDGENGRVDGVTWDGFVEVRMDNGDPVTFTANQLEELTEEAPNA